MGMEYKIDPKLLEILMEGFQVGEQGRFSPLQRDNLFERNDSERQRQNAYFEQHWPEYRDMAIVELRASLGAKPPVAKQQLSSGKTLEFRVGNYKDADNINMRDHEFYSTTALAINREGTSSFRIASFSDSPLEPVGFYFVMNYFENDKYWTKRDHEGQRKVGEVKLIYVSPSSRGHKLGSILTANSALDIVDDESRDILRFEVANKRVEHVLSSLGFQPIGKATYGYDDFKIDLAEREVVRQIFQQYLSQFRQAPSPNQ
jgi:GNAT superfamily N-acetyltransferase